MEIEIFYQLVLSSGASYKDSSVDRVSVNANGDIINLRKAVKLENPQIPATIGPAQLLVYKTKADLLDPARLPLDPRQPLDIETEYLVVVPDDSQQGTSV